MNLKSTIFFIVSILLSSSLLQADELYLKNGDVLHGTFLRIKGEFYVFKTKKGFIRYVPQDKVDDLGLEQRQALSLQKK